jgi:hypothetical protein
MMPPDLFLLLHRQRHREMARQAEQARLARASRRKAAFGELVFHPLLWWVGGALLSWECALQQAGRATKAAEKGCSVCLR